MTEHTKVEIMKDTEIAWNMLLAYRMVRQRYYVLTDRQRKLQGEQEILSKQRGELRAQIKKLAHSIAVVEEAGGESQNLRTQIAAAHAEANRIEPRHDYLEKATLILAANLRQIGPAHDALHWLKFENRKLADFDRDHPEVPSL